MVIDVIWQLIAGSDGLSSSGMLAGNIQSTFDWMAGQTNYALTGAGNFVWFPPWQTAG